MFKIFFHQIYSITFVNLYKRALEIKERITKVNESFYFCKLPPSKIEHTTENKINFSTIIFWV